MSKSSGFLSNVIGRPCSPLSYTSDNIVNEALDLSELSRQLEKIRLNSQQQQQQKNVVTSISSELCGLFDNFSAADDDHMFSWQGKSGICQDDEDDDINFSELFPEPGSGKIISHSCSYQVEIKQSAIEGRNIEPISSSTSSFGKRKAEMLECYNRDKTKKVTTRESVRRRNKNKEANNLVCSLKASANQKPGFKRTGKKYSRTPEHQCRHY